MKAVTSNSYMKCCRVAVPEETDADSDPPAEASGHAVTDFGVNAQLPAELPWPFGLPEYIEASKHSTAIAVVQVQTNATRMQSRRILYSPNHDATILKV